MGYAASRETSDWDANITLNGEPALRMDGTAVGTFGVTPFVVNGRNTALLTASCRKQEISLREHCAVEVLAISWQQASFEMSTLGGIREGEGSIESELTAQFEFMAEVPVRWRWQDADIVTPLAAGDRTKIEALFRKFVTAIERQSWKEVRELTIPWWTAMRPVPIWADPSAQDEVRQHQIERISRFADYGVYAPGNEDISLEVGQRVVRMNASREGDVYSEPLLSIGHGGFDQRLSIENLQIPALYFIRENGEWRMMLPSWESESL